MQIKGTKLAEGKPLTGEGRSAENSINLLQIYYVYGMVIYTTLIRKNLYGVVFCHDCESLSEKNRYLHFPNESFTCCKGSHIYDVHMDKGGSLEIAIFYLFHWFKIVGKLFIFVSERGVPKLVIFRALNLNEVKLTRENRYTKRYLFLRLLKQQYYHYLKISVI